MKGKYAAKAANRAASVDNEVIIELRHALANEKSTNEYLRQQLQREQKQRSSTVLTLVKKQTAQVVKDCRDTVTAERQRHETVRNQAADEAAKVIREFVKALNYFSNDGACVPQAVINDSGGEHPSLLGLFALLAPERAAQLFDDCFQGLDGWSFSRRARRRSAHRMRKDMHNNAQNHYYVDLVEQIKSNINN